MVLECHHTIFCRWVRRIKILQWKSAEQNYAPNYGADYYAAVTYKTTPDKQPTSIGWVNNWGYANEIPTNPWKGAMALPRKLSVKKAGNEWVLVQEPVEPAFLFDSFLEHAPFHGLVKFRWLYLVGSQCWLAIYPDENTHSNGSIISGLFVLQISLINFDPSSITYRMFVKWCGILWRTIGTHFFRSQSSIPHLHKAQNTFEGPLLRAKNWKESFSHWLIATLISLGGFISEHSDAIFHLFSPIQGLPGASLLIRYSLSLSNT